MSRFLNILALILFVATAPAETFVSTDVPIHIPDGPSGIARSHLTIPVNRQILDLNITFTITHTWVGDLNIYLEHLADSTTVRLIYRGCGSQNSGDNFANTMLDDEAGTYVCNSNAPYTGTFQPEHPLYAFDGLSTLGDWEFRVTDNAAGDTGSIQAWRLDIVGDSLPSENPPVLSPSSFLLSSYPNPFNSVTTLSFSLPRTARVLLAVYGLTGRKISILADQAYPSGEHQIPFVASDLPSGLYLARLSIGAHSQTHKLLLVK